MCVRYNSKLPDFSTRWINCVEVGARALRLLKKHMKTIIGYIGEKCAQHYLKKLGFKFKLTGRFDNLPYYHADIKLRKYTYPKVVNIKPKEAYDFETGEFADDIDVEITYGDAPFEYRNVEVKTSFGRFPRLSNTLSSQQRKRLNDLLFLLVKIKKVTPEGIIYEVREVPPNWTSSESIEPWKGKRPWYPTKEQLKEYIEKMRKKKDQSS